MLLEGPCSTLDARAGRGRVLAEGSESVAEGDEYPFMLGGGEVDRVAIGGGGSIGRRGYPGVGQAFFHLAEGDLRQFSLLRVVKAGPDGREVSKVGWRIVVGGSGAVGRKSGVRPVLDPVVARRSVGPMGEKSRSGPEAEGGGESVLVVALSAVPVLFLGDAMVDEVVDMAVREARKAARGVKSRGGATRTVKGGWSATCVVTRGAGAELL